MSMFGTLARLSQVDLALIHQDAAVVGALLGRTQSRVQPAPGLLARLFGKRSPPAEQPPHAGPQPIPESEKFDVEGAWHILHFLFTGTAWDGAMPEGFLVSAGTEVGPDLGYGPARMFSPGEVQVISSFLQGLTPELLAGRYVAADIERAELYWQVSRTDAEIRAQVDDLWAYVLELREFMRVTAARNSAMLAVIE